MKRRNIEMLNAFVLLQFCFRLRFSLYSLSRVCAVCVLCGMFMCVCIFSVHAIVLVWNMRGRLQLQMHIGRRACLHVCTCDGVCVLLCIRDIVCVCVWLRSCMLMNIAIAHFAFVNSVQVFASVALCIVHPCGVRCVQRESHCSTTKNGKGIHIRVAIEMKRKETNEKKEQKYPPPSKRQRPQ